MKLKIITLLTLTIVLSACGNRNNPDGLSVIKYNKIVIPKKLVLVKPTDSNNELQTTIINDGSVDITILSKFNIKKSNPNVKKKVSQIKNSEIVVDIKEEDKRIKQNIKKGKSVTAGKTPSINVRKTKTGVDELFED